MVSQVCPGPVSTEFGDVAGMASGEMPAFLQLSAEQCAEEALAGFSQGKAMIIPGQVMRLSMGLVRLFPRGVMRLAFSGMRKRMLKEQQRHHESALQAG